MDHETSAGYCFGFSLWKQLFIDITSFFEIKPRFIHVFFQRNLVAKALAKGMKPESVIYIWGRKSFPDIEKYAKENGCSIYRVEDGFIRSIGLGSDLTQPYSLVMDRRGIYFDPTAESDLEHILQNHSFTEAEISRAKGVRDYLIANQLSKYNLYKNKMLNFPKNRKVVLVPGQVEDDASIRYGATGMDNLELLRQTRLNCPDAYIVYKPHPDVLVGNRIGQVDETEALRYCDRIVTEVGISSVLVHADEVHTMTSLVGFEALLRGIKVVTYGVPFYAGWGLTEDYLSCKRRSRNLKIDELVAGTYLLYPRYIHPETLNRCEIEDVMESLERKRKQTQNSLWIQWRNGISRKLQAVLRGLKGIV